MFKSPISESIDSEHGIKIIPRTMANFYLNRYPFSVVETDPVLGDPDPNNFSYGIEDIMSVENISQTYRYGHGNSYTILGGTTKPPKLNNYKIPSRVPQSRLYIAGDDVSYKYYMTPVKSTSGGPDTGGTGFHASTGNYLGQPQVEYFDENNVNYCLPGNSIVLKWNSVSSVPTAYKIWLKMRDIDSTDTPAWVEIYDSVVDGTPKIKTGERYGVTSVLNTDGATTRLQLSVFDDSLPGIPSTGVLAGRRRTWVSGDYMDISIGDNVVINKADNSVNGVAKVTGVNLDDGWIEVYSTYEINKTLDDTDYSIEVYALDAGEVKFYRQSGSEWSTQEKYFTEDENNLVDICGARVDIIGIDQRSSRAELIELSPVLSADLTSYTTSVQISEELSDRDVTIPIGTISANTGTVSLNNSTSMFNESNARRKLSPGVWGGSYFAGMLSDSVEFKIHYEVISLQTGISDIIPVCPMVSDTWAPPMETEASVSVNLLDYSKFLQDRPCPDLVLNNHPITSIVYMLMDKCAFSRVIGWPENNTSTGAEPVVEWFWCRKEDTVWSILQSLAKSTQTSIFFDRYGYLRILPLHIMSNRDRGESGKNVATLRAVTTKEGLSNIVSMQREQSVAANKVLVKYHPASIHGEAGKIARDTFWLPDDNYGMGVAKLKQAIEATDTVIRTVSNGKEPPFPRLQGYVSVGNNIIQYDATQVELRSAPGGTQKRWLKNEVERLRAVLDNNGQEVVYNGILKIKTGQEARLRKALATELGGFKYTSVYIHHPSKNCSANKLVSFSPKEDALVIDAPDIHTNQMVVGSKHYSSAYESVAMKFKVTRGHNFDATGSKKSMFGITLFNQTINGHETCYLVTALLGDDYSRSGKESAVRLYRICKGGAMKWIPKVSHSGPKNPTDMGVPIKKDTWNWLEARVDGFDNTFMVEVFLNGTRIGSFKDVISGYGGRLNRTKSAGMFAKNGRMVVDKFIVMDIPRQRPTRFESKAMMNSRLERVRESRITFFKKSALKKTAHSGRVKKHLKWTDIDRIYDQYISSIRKRRGARIWIDEFSNVLKEYVEDSVRFENGPALTAEVVNLNPNVHVDKFITSPFGSKFSLRNNSNKVQLLSGTQLVENVDESTSAEQYIAIVGNAIVKTDAENTVSLKDYIGRVGERKLEVDCEWIQSYAQSQQLAEWVLENQGDGAEIYSILLSRNVLLEIGDSADIEYAEKGLLPTKQRFVIESVSNDDSGTKVMARRIYPKPTDIRSGSLSWD